MSVVGQMENARDVAKMLIIEYALEKIRHLGKQVNVRGVQRM
jgi:hypothetical protein